MLPTYLVPILYAACLLMAFGLGSIITTWRQGIRHTQSQLEQDVLVAEQIMQFAQLKQQQRIDKAYIAQLEQELRVSYAFAEECKAAIRQHGIQQQHQREEEEKKGA